MIVFNGRSNLYIYKVICAQQKPESAWESAQSEQGSLCAERFAEDQL